jgi:hypothetical protein
MSSTRFLLIGLISVTVAAVLWRRGEAVGPVVTGHAARRCLNGRMAAVEQSDRGQTPGTAALAMNARRGKANRVSRLFGDFANTIARAVGRPAAAFRVAVGLLIAAWPAMAGATTAAPAPIMQIEERINEAVRVRANDPRLKGLTEKQRRERIEFVAGNVLFAMAHEVGHMLIAEMGLPVLGREEDAADTFAVVNLLSMSNSFSTRVLTQSARGWFLSDRRNQKENIPMAFYDEHGLDRQRAYNIVCLMVGSNPENFRELATTTKLPEERQSTCRRDYSNASWSWEKALAPHMRKPDQPKTKIEVNYAKSEKYPIFARGFRRILMLEEIAEYLSNRFIWHRPIGLEMRECGEPAAYWDLSTRKVTICYELCTDFEQLHSGYATEEQSAAKKARKKRRPRLP